MSKADGAHSPVDTCPHLGLEEDAQTCTAYPSRWNICHHSKPASVVRLEHQRNVCLSSGHANCPVFQDEKIQALPVHLRGRRKATEGNLSRSIMSVNKET
jgi:hypothetical protein